ncbi:MAG: single-stranded DNA-binding protein [Breznakia sp.]
MIKAYAAGRLTADIRLKELIGGDKDLRVANFTLACRDNEVTEFVEVTAWNNVAITLSKFAKKGDMIFIEGRLKSNEYVDEKNNMKHKKVFINVDTFEFLERKKKEEKTLFDEMM